MKYLRVLKTKTGWRKTEPLDEGADQFAGWAAPMPHHQIPFASLPCAKAWMKGETCDPVTMVTFNLTKFVTSTADQTIKYIYEEQ